MPQYYIMEDIPHTVFIIPYRDRAPQAKYFMEYFKYYVSRQPGMNKGAIYLFSHQVDKRPFNRGAMKNIGFLKVKELYPDNWEDITLVFHDVDCYPKWGVKLPYTTTPGKVAHYYGFKYTLGGIVVIKGSDFEKTGGFPNYWGWGYEDNLFAQRVNNEGLEIDRSIFFDVNDLSSFTRLDKHDEEKLVSRKDADTYMRGESDTFNDITDLRSVVNLGKNVINTTYFEANLQAPRFEDLTIYDLRSRERSLIKYLNQRGAYRSGRTWGMVNTTTSK